MIKQGLLLSLIVLLVLAATTTGIFFRTADPNVEGTSLRGQHLIYQGSGLYRYNPVSFVREGVVWDYVNLLIGLPLLALASVFALRGSLRGKLFLSGLLAYFWYVYLGTVMMTAFNNLFLVYVAVIALTIVAFVLNIKDIKVPALPTRFSERFPRKTFVGFFLLLAVVLLVLWLSRIVAVMRTGLFPEEYAGMLTLGSQALDLGLLVPLSLGTAALLMRKSAWGYLLASVCMPFGLLMFISIPLWATVPLIQDGKANLFEAVPFYSISLFGIGLTLVFLLSIRRKATTPMGNARESA
jgi:hypothetical protein